MGKEQAQRVQETERGADDRVRGSSPHFVARVAAVIVGLILMLAAVEKAAAPKATIAAMESLVALVAGGTPRLGVATAVLPLCILELALGSLLFAGVAQRAAAGAALIFLALATLAVVMLALHRPAQACGCGMRWLSVGFELGPWGASARNIALMILVIPAGQMRHAPCDAAVRPGISTEH